LCVVLADTGAVRGLFQNMPGQAPGVEFQPPRLTMLRAAVGTGQVKVPLSVIARPTSNRAAEVERAFVALEAAAMLAQIDTPGVAGGREAILVIGVDAAQAVTVRRDLPHRRREWTQERHDFTVLIRECEVQRRPTRNRPCVSRAAGSAPTFKSALTIAGLACRAA